MIQPGDKVWILELPVEGKLPEIYQDQVTAVAKDSGADAPTSFTCKLCYGVFHLHDGKTIPCLTTDTSTYLMFSYKYKAYDYIKEQLKALAYLSHLDLNLTPRFKTPYKKP